MDQIRTRRIAVFPAEHEEVRLTTIPHAADRDPVGLVYDLQDRRQVSVASKWMLKAVDASGQMSILTQDLQYLILFYPEYRPSPNKVAALVEKRGSERSKK